MSTTRAEVTGRRRRLGAAPIAAPPPPARGPPDSIGSDLLSGGAAIALSGLALQETPKSPIVRRVSGRRPDASQRSAVTNGKRLHVVRPGDTAWARRFRDILAEIISDIGGRDGLSEGQRQLARRAATIAIACEKMEGEAAAGRDIDLDTYGQMTDRLGRCFHRLGLRRQARDVERHGRAGRLSSSGCHQLAPLELTSGDLLVHNTCLNRARFHAGLTRASHATLDRQF